jgi:cytochrome c-type biogenesis protein CcmH/NrfG
MIGGALDGTGPLRWIDAWPLLNPGQRDAIRTLTQASSRALARARRCAYFVTGRLIGRGDSVEVALELNDVAGDSTVIRGTSSGRSADAWRLALLAVNELLPSLISGSRPDVTAEWNDREPGVVADYLLGEAAFRRAQLGEALSRFRNAVKADSTFGLAAVRGAQAATWSHEPAEAALFIRTALRQRLSPRYTHFALGYSAYLEGRADSAAAEFRRSLAIDPEMAEAWMQLGEVYTHLLPFAGRVDSLARVALETAHRIDPRATNSLLHLIEIHLRAGDSTAAAPLVQAFLGGHPDNPVTTDRVRLMQTCVRGGTNRVDWRGEARRNRPSVLGAATALSAAGAQLGCAIPALAEVVRADTSAAGDDRWFALLQLRPHCSPGDEPPMPSPRWMLGRAPTRRRRCTSSTDRFSPASRPRRMRPPPTTSGNVRTGSGDA